MSHSRDLKNSQKNHPGFHQNPKDYVTSCHGFGGMIKLKLMNGSC